VGLPFENENLLKYTLAANPICNPSIFPDMNILVKLLATLPVTAATHERSFSTP
jgi:hypothetical protein